MQQASQEDRVTASTIEAISRFNSAFNRRDVDAIMAAMTEDCVFESTSPAPDGRRHQGQTDVRKVWEELFGSSSDSTFETEEMFACGDRCVARWLYRWIGKDGNPSDVRGVDVFRVYDGKVAQKLAYVKG